MTNDERRERGEMWQNFLWACQLGTVVLDAEERVWQKLGTECWKTVGASSDYSADSIHWPVDVLVGGIG